MFRCVFRLRASAIKPAKRLPSLASSGSRGIKLSESRSISSDKQIPRSVSFYPPFTKEGRKHLERLRENDIGLYTELKAVKHLAWKGIQIRVAPRHVTSSQEMRYFTEMGHASAEFVVRRNLSSRDKPLWMITTSKGADLKPIVRGRAKDRMIAALKQALRNSGYDVDGRRLSEEQLEKQRLLLGKADYRPLARDMPQLYGTVEVVSRDSKLIPTIPFAELRDHFEKLVRHLAEELGQTAEGRPAKPTVHVRPPSQYHQSKRTKPPNERAVRNYKTGH